MPDKDILLFLMRLLADVESVVVKEHNSDKEGAPHPNSTPVDILPDSMKRLYIVYNRMEARFQEKYAGHFEKLGNRTWEEYSPEEKAHQLSYVKDQERLQIVDDLFWQGVRESFTQTRGKITEVCAGWQVVTLEGNKDCVGCYRRLACNSSINPWRPAPNMEATAPKPEMVYTPMVDGPGGNGD